MKKSTSISHCSVAQLGVKQKTKQSAWGNVTLCRHSLTPRRPFPVTCLPSPAPSSWFGPLLYVLLERDPCALCEIGT